LTPDGLRDRVTSVCARLGYLQAQTPFSFELQPSGAVDEVFRIEGEALTVIGGFNYTEERTDLLTIWLARKHHSAPTEMYRRLTQDVSSIRAAVVRDGHQTSGEYSVPDDGWAWTIQRETGNGFAVLQVAMPCNYETTL
jgi:hypothetical protein